MYTGYAGVYQIDTSTAINVTVFPDPITRHGRERNPPYRDVVAVKLARVCIVKSLRSTYPRSSGPVITGRLERHRNRDSINTSKLTSLLDGERHTHHRQRKR